MGQCAEMDADVVTLAERRVAPVITKPVPAPAEPTTLTLLKHMLSFSESLCNVMVYARSLEARIANLEREASLTRSMLR